MLDAVQDWYVLNLGWYDKLKENIGNSNYRHNILDPNSPSHDIGPGNFRQSTAQPLFEKYILGRDISRDEGRKLTDTEEHLRKYMQEFLFEHVDINSTEKAKKRSFIENMILTPKGTAWLAAAEMLHGKQMLYDAGALDGLSEPEIAAVLMTWYKQGDRYLKRYLDSRKNGRIGSIRPGEGVNLFFYPEQFEKY